MISTISMMFDPKGKKGGFPIELKHRVDHVDRASRKEGLPTPSRFQLS